MSFIASRQPAAPMFRLRGLGAALVCLVLPFSTAACRATEGGGEDGVSAVQFQDVVVPSGLRLIDGSHESASREVAGWRQGRFVYQGDTRIEDAIAYVRQRMPQHNWEVTGSVNLEPPGCRLQFARGIYSAEYTFERREGVTQMVVDYRTDYSRR